MVCFVSDFFPSAYSIRDPSVLCESLVLCHSAQYVCLPTRRVTGHSTQYVCLLTQ